MSFMEGLKKGTRQAKKAKSQRPSVDKMHRFRSLRTSTDSDVESWNDGTLSASSSMTNLSVLGAGGRQSDSDAENPDAPTKQELVEERLLEAMDLVLEKATSHRVNGLKTLRKYLHKVMLSDFIESRLQELCDILERSLKRGKGEEQILACSVGMLICTQLEGHFDIYEHLKPVLRTIMYDKSVPIKVRASCIDTLAYLCFVTCDPLDYIPIMEDLEKLWKSSPVEGEIHTAALAGWSLLSTMMSTERSANLLKMNLEQFCAYFEVNNVDLKIAVGEAIAVLYENVWGNPEFQDEIDDLLDDKLDLLRGLTQGSQKHNSKRDRKEQKSIFRDILKTVEDGEEYYDEVKFGQGELLELNSWVTKRQYDALAKALSSGVPLYLAYSVHIRDLFDMGDPLEDFSLEKRNKSERMLGFKETHKVRQQQRKKNRDKRNVS